MTCPRSINSVVIYWDDNDYSYSDGKLSSQSGCLYRACLFFCGDTHGIGINFMGLVIDSTMLFKKHEFV